MSGSRCGCWSGCRSGRRSDCRSRCGCRSWNNRGHPGRPIGCPSPCDTCADDVDVSFPRLNISVRVGRIRQIITPNLPIPSTRPILHIQLVDPSTGHSCPTNLHRVSNHLCCQYRPGGQRSGRYRRCGRRRVCHQGCSRGRMRDEGRGCGCVSRTFYWPIVECDGSGPGSISVAIASANPHFVIPDCKHARSNVIGSISRIPIVVWSGGKILTREPPVDVVVVRRFARGAPTNTRVVGTPGTRTHNNNDNTCKSSWSLRPQPTCDCRGRRACSRWLTLLSLSLQCVCRGRSGCVCSSRRVRRSGCVCSSRRVRRGGCVCSSRRVRRSGRVRSYHCKRIRRPCARHSSGAH